MRGVDLRAVTPELLDYAEALSAQEPPYLRAVREETEQGVPRAHMLCGPVEGALLRLLVALHRPRTVLEIGTFTGYSALWMAGALPEGSVLHTVEADEGLHTTARRHFDASGLGPRIQSHLGRAPQVLAGIPGPFDLVFLDADKRGYTACYEFLFPRVPVGGLMVADNVLFRGEVLHPGRDRGKIAEALHRFNEQVAGDPRVEVVLLPVRDGLSLIRKISD